MKNLAIAATFLLLMSGTTRVDAGNLLINGGFEDEPNYEMGVINGAGTVTEMALRPIGPDHLEAAAAYRASQNPI